MNHYLIDGKHYITASSKRAASLKLFGIVVAPLRVVKMGSN